LITKQDKNRKEINNMKMRFKYTSSILAILLIIQSLLFTTAFANGSNDVRNAPACRHALAFSFNEVSF